MAPQVPLQALRRIQSPPSQLVVTAIVYSQARLKVQSMTRLRTTYMELQYNLVTMDLAQATRGNA